MKTTVKVFDRDLRPLDGVNVRIFLQNKGSSPFPNPKKYSIDSVTTNGKVEFDHEPTNSAIIQFDGRSVSNSGSFVPPGILYFVEHEGANLREVYRSHLGADGNGHVQVDHTFDQSKLSKMHSA